MKISPESQIEVTDTIVSSVMENYGLDFEAYQEVDEGISNRVVRVLGRESDIYFLKFYKSTHSRKFIEREIDFLGNLAGEGLLVPEYILPNSPNEGSLVVASGKNGQHYTSLTRVLPGSHPEHYSGGIVAQMGELHAELHNLGRDFLSPENFSPFHNYHLFDVSGGSKRLEAVEKELIKVSRELIPAWQTLPSGLVPLDIKRNNTLAMNNRLTGLIDFADINIAPLVFCLAGTLWDLLEDQPTDNKLMETYIEKYQGIRDLVQSEWEVLRNTIALRGRIALHGSLLTLGLQSEIVDYQLGILEGLLHKPTFS